MKKESEGTPEKKNDLVQQFAELLTITRKDKGKTEKCCDKAEVATTVSWKKKLKQCFLRLKATLEQVDKMTEVVEEKAWYLSQSSNTKSQHVDADFFFTKKKRKPFWISSKNIAGTDKAEVISMMVSLHMQRAKV